MRQAIVLAIVVAACSGGGRGHYRYRESSLIPHDEIELAGRALGANEAKLVDANGFAIVGGKGASSFHVGYTALFHKHQPVYITADSLLYAWHSSYDAILSEVEQTYLIPALLGMLTELRTKLVDAPATAQAKADVDAYLAIALALATGKPAAPVAGGDPSLIAATVQKGQAAGGPGSVELFGRGDDFDFTMLKPRGHYALYPELQQYFRAMMWLGRVEVRIATKRTPKDPWAIDRRALAGTLLLGSLFTGTTRAAWDRIDSTVAAFVGPPDSMSLPGLTNAVAALGGKADAPDDAVIAAFGKPATQRIRTQLQLAGAQAIAFVTLGQRYVLDSQVFSDLTYGSLASKPDRLMPTPLDIGHAVLHNPVAKQLLAGELARYGKPYADALDAAAREPDPALWTGSLYHGWLRALRELSPDPARDAGLPAPLASDAWQKRMLATQLASWAELRHDNLLYAKQSFTAELLCEYPDAYVDPYPAFYEVMANMAKRGRAAVAKLGSSPKLDAYFDKLADAMMRLHAIAERERANQPLTADDLTFVNKMVSIDGRSGGCTTVLEPQGWYADMFYDRSKILWHEAVIADVHTQPDDEAGNRVGRVLHAGTRPPRMLVVRLQHDGGTHAQTYRGFVSTYAETITKNFERLTDEEWRERQDKLETTPAWLGTITTR